MVQPWRGEATSSLETRRGQLLTGIAVGLTHRSTENGERPVNRADATSPALMYPDVPSKFIAVLGSPGKAPDAPRAMVPLMFPLSAPPDMSLTVALVPVSPSLQYAAGASTITSDG